MPPPQTVTDWLYALAEGAEAQSQISHGLVNIHLRSDWDVAAKHLMYARKCDKAGPVFLEAARMIEELGLTNPEIVPPTAD